MSRPFFTPDERLRLWVEDELLKLSDETWETTRSDLQGRAHPVAQGIIEKVRSHGTGEGVTVTLSQNELDVILDRVNDWDIERTLRQARDAQQGSQEDSEQH